MRLGIVLWLLGILGLQAQPFRERIISMQQAYAGIEAAHIIMTVEVYENDESSVPYFKETADVKRQAGNYHYQFGSINMLMNTRCLVMVDKGSKKIMYTPRSLGDEQKIFRDPFKANLDSILALYENPTFLGSDDNGDHFRIFQKVGEIKQIDLFIDQTNNQLSRLEYRYKDSHYVAIAFNRFEKQPVFETDTFNENKYVVQENGRLKAARELIGYRVATVDGN